MSIRVMTMVSDLCIYQAGMLLTLLVMADCSDDEGYNIFPARDLIAARARMSERNAQGCVARMREDGVLVLLDDAGDDLPASAVFPGGRGKVPRYRLNLAQLRDMQAAHKQVEPGCPWCEARAKRAQRATRKGEGGDTKGRRIEHCIKKEPSLTVNEPSAGADGAGKGKAKSPPRTVIGDWAPGIHEREKATQFWMAHMRPDLVANIETILGHFTAHHRAAGSRMADWPSAWQTWYSRSLRDRPMAAAPRVATVAGVTIEQWMYRLRAWHLGIPDDGVSLEVPKGFWDKRWGPSPAKGAKIPPEAESEFNRRFPAGRVASR